MTAAGLIFSNIHDDTLREMTARRTMASVPFGGRYRLIDFPLSCMVNAGIVKVGVIAHNNYQSLLGHLGSGKDWDLARRSGGIKILPPLITAYDNAVAGRVYSTRLEALMGVSAFIERCTEDFVVLSDSNAIFQMDLRRVIDAHERSRADITFVTKKMPRERCAAGKDVKVMTKDSEGRLTDLKEFDALDHGGEYEVYTNVMVVTRTYLHAVVRDAIARGYSSFFRDVIGRRIREDNFAVYPYSGYYDMIVSLRGYYACSMEMLEDETRRELFGNASLPVYTKVRNSPPTLYCEGAAVKNSMIADGCKIEGTVENSILFRGVQVGKGTVVRNSILFQNTYVGANSFVNCVTTDKNVVICDERMLSGHETQPFYIEKGKKI